MAMLDNKLIVIIGLGKTGLSCAKFLSDKPYRLAVMDNRSNPPCLAEMQANFPKIPMPAVNPKASDAVSRDIPMLSM